MVAEESDSRLDYRFKIIVAGNGGVGKTTLLKRYVDGTFITSTKMTIALEFHQKLLFPATYHQPFHYLPIFLL